MTVKPKTRIAKPYTTRSLRTDLLDRMRILAAVESAALHRRVTVEAILNRVIEKGLTVLEGEVLK